MTLDDILQNFLSLTQDAVAVGYRSAGESSARLIYVNEGFTELFGYTLGDVEGEIVSILHTPEDWNDFTRKIEPDVRAGSPSVLAEARCTRSDGGVFWASLSIILLAEDDTGGRFSIATYRDITELKNREARATAALRERDRILEEKDEAFKQLTATQTRLYSAMDAHPGPFAIFDKDLVLVTCNTAYRQSLAPDPDLIAPGMSLPEILNQAIDTGIYPEPPEGREKFIFDGQRDEPVTDYELSGDVHHRVLRSVTEDGDYVILRLDITEIVRQRRSAEKAETRLIEAINAYPDPFVIFDEDLKLVICNDAYKSSMSDDPDNIRPGMHVRDVLSHAIDKGVIAQPRQGRDQYITDAIDAAQRGVSTDQIELSGDRHQKVLRNVTSLGDFVIIRLDVTELVRQRRAAEQVQNRMFDAINAYPDPFVIYDADMRLVTCNRAYAMSMAESPDSIKPGMSFVDVARQAERDGKFPVTSESANTFIENMTLSAKLGTRSQDIEYPDGTHHRILRSVSENGDVVILRLDITELVNQRRKAEEAQNRLVSAIGTYPDPFSIFDKDRKLVICNEAYRTFTAKKPDMIQEGMHFRDILEIAVNDGCISTGGLDKDTFIDAFIEDFSCGDSVQDIELDNDVHHRAMRTASENGDVVSIRIDITEIVRQQRAAKAAERAAVDAQDRLTSAISAYPDPFSIFDNQQYLIICNDAYRASMSTDPDSIRPGMHFSELLMNAIECGVIQEPEGGVDAHIKQVVEQLSAGSRTMDAQLEGDIHHRIILSKAKNGDAVSMRIDITELVRQTRAAEAAQDRLLSAVSAYPGPYCIYDSDYRLIVFNEEYARGFSDDLSDIQAGMSLEDVMWVGLNNGVFADAVGQEGAWLKKMLGRVHATIPVDDLAIAGDVHHRLFRSRSDNGDLIMVRVDMTEQVRQSRALNASQNRLISSINAFPDPFSIFDSDGHLVMWNPAYANSITDNPDDIRLGMQLEEILLLAARNGRVPAAKGREEPWAHEFSLDAAEHPVEEEIEFSNDTHFRIMRSRTELGETMVLRLDITESVRQRRALEEYAKRLETANAEITYKALHDELTGLGNRRHLTDNFKQLCDRRKTEGGELSVLHIDLDRFKQINDTIGHAAGDHVLREVANRIKAKADPADIVARIGGDEFIVLIWEPQPSQRPLSLSVELISELSKPVIYDDRNCRFGASVGLAQTPLAEVDRLLAFSDIALYKAKRAGRGQVGVFDAQDVDDMRRTKAIADDILRGLEDSEFVPYYQPQIDARSGRVVGVEALARWHHPEQGVLLPNSFLTVAGDLNVESDIDRIIFEKALSECEAVFEGHDPYPSLSFNVSAKRIHEDVFDDIARAVRSYPGEVAFELLETIFLEEQDDGFLMQLDRLRELGISIEVDDFGSGRASVVALQRIAPDRLKIDGRLVRPMKKGTKSARLVQSMIEIGNALNIGVVAEGVETADHAKLLTELGVERLQGYYFARPLPLDGLREFLAQDPIRKFR